MNVYVVECCAWADPTGWKVRGASAVLDDAKYLADDLAGPDGDVSVRVTEWRPDGTSAAVYRPAVLAD